MAKNIIKLGSSKTSDQTPVETVEVFELDDKVYSVPKKVSAGISLKYLKLQAEEGPDAAMYFIMKKMLGEEAFEALSEHESLEKDDLAKIMEIVEKHALSDEEGK